SVKYKGVVRLFFDLKPRFPEIGSDGVVRQRVHIFHTRPDPVTITKVTLQMSFDDQSERAAEEVDPAMFGSTVIPPSGLDAELSIDTHADPRLIAKNYAIEGASGDGLPATGRVSVMRPPRFSRDTMAPIDDPALQAKIMLAMQILGKQTVTDEDLRELARQ